MRLGNDVVTNTTQGLYFHSGTDYSIARTIELHELGGLQVAVNVMVRVRHREGLHTHSGRAGDTLWDLNFELGVDAIVVLLGTR